MFIVRRLSRLSRTLQFALVAAAAFAVGSATVAAAATAGIPIGTLFYLPMINGTATAPCSSAAGASGPTTTCNAIVDSNGNLHVTSTGTSTVSGAVSVNNLPADQQVHGTVGVNNLPDTQKITGHVNVDNLPPSQTVDGTVNVGNLPTDASGNLKVATQGATAGAPTATKVQYFYGSITHASGGPSYSRLLHVNMNVTFISLQGCSRYNFYLSGGPASTPLGFTANGTTAFPIALTVTDLSIDNEDQVFDCNYTAYVVGY